MRALFSVAVSAAALFLLAGCDSFGEPERFFNEDARPPTVGALDLADVQPGQHLAGSVRLALDLDSLAGRVTGVSVALDGEEVWSANRPPFAFALQTEQYAEGAHDLAVSVYVRGAETGLLGVVGAPSVYLTSRVVFDQRPPTPLALTAVEVEGGRPRLTWTPSTDANFYAYLIVRHAPWTPTVGGFEWLPVVDTLYDRATTEYVDAALPAFYGAQADYEIRVWNRRDMSRSAGTTSATFGASVEGISSSSNAAAFSADGAEMYVLTGTALVAFSTADHRVLRRLEYAAVSPGGLLPSHLALGPSGDELFFALPDPALGEYRRRLYVVGTADFRVRRSFPLPEGAYGAIVGPDLYAVGGGRLHVMDAQTGAVEATSDAVFGDPAHAVGISADGASLYVTSYVNNGYWSTATLRRVDLAARPLRPVGSFTWYSSQLPGGAFKFGDDGRVYVQTGGTVAVLDGRTLEQVSGYDLNVSSGWSPLIGVTAAGNRLYVSHHVTHSGFDGSAVHEHDLATGRRLRTWRFAVQVNSVRTNGAGWLYVDGWDNARDAITTWLVPLGS